LCFCLKCIFIRPPKQPTNQSINHFLSPTHTNQHTFFLNLPKHFNPKMPLSFFPDSKIPKAPYCIATQQIKNAKKKNPLTI
jgi:hypothetical protein